MFAEGQARPDDAVARELYDRYPNEWVALGYGDMVIAHAANAANLFRDLGDRDDVRLVFIEGPREPVGIVDVSTIIAEATKDHYPTRGMQVSMGVTCRCGHWTGSEPEAYLGAGVGGRDQLGRHRAVVAAQALLGAGVIR